MKLTTVPDIESVATRRTPVKMATILTECKWQVAVHVQDNGSNQHNRLLIILVMKCGPFCGLLEFRLDYNSKLSWELFKFSEWKPRGNYGEYNLRWVQGLTCSQVEYVLSGNKNFIVLLITLGKKGYASWHANCFYR